MKLLNEWRWSEWAGWIRMAVLVLTCLPAALAFGQSATRDKVVFIVNKANPVGNLTIEELQKYFRLEHERWPNGRKNTVLMLPPNTPARDLVLREIYHFTESEFREYFIQESFAGHVQSAPKELASAANVCKFVFNVPGAIGYVRASEVDDTVKVVCVNGRAPTDEKYPFIITDPSIK